MSAGPLPPELALKKLRQILSRIDARLAMLETERLWLRAAGSFNSIPTLCLHLSGNVGQHLFSSTGNRSEARPPAGQETP
jgi:hypothetical protein